MPADLQRAKASGTGTRECAAHGDKSRRKAAPTTGGIYPAIAIALLFSVALRAAVAPAEWKFQQSLSLNETGLVRVALPPATLDRAQPDLADVRLLNPSGQEVPYAMEIPPTPALTRAAPKHFRVELQ